MNFAFYKTLEDMDKGLFAYEVSDITAESYSGNRYGMDYSEGSGIIDDRRGGKSISEQGMVLRGKIRFSGVKNFFSEEGLVSGGTAMGVAAVCSSSTSDYRNAFPMFELDKESDIAEETFEIKIPPGVCRDKLLFRIVLYVKNPAKEDKARGLVSGLLLGDVRSEEFRIGRNRLMFPVTEAEEPKKPLWWVRHYWTSVDEQPFSSEFVRVVFNKSHPAYPKIDYSKGNDKFDTDFLTEVMASAMQIIIEEIRVNPEEWKKILSDSTFPAETIAFTIQYMRQTYFWDFETPESLSNSIHEFVGEKIKGVGVIK